MRPIDADALKEKIEIDNFDAPMMNPVMTMTKVLECIDEAPTIEPDKQRGERECSGCLDELYQTIRDHHYQILSEKESDLRRARLSLSTWILDEMSKLMENNDVKLKGEGDKE